MRITSRLRVRTSVAVLLFVAPLGCASSGTDESSGTAGSAGTSAGTAGVKGAAGARAGSGGSASAGKSGGAGGPNPSPPDAAVSSADTNTPAPPGDTAASTPDAGTGAAVRSAGCGKARSEARATWVEKTVTVRGAPRSYFVYLPKTYDPQRAYRTAMMFHGCTSETNNVPLWTVSGEDAIFARGKGTGNNVCWTYDPNGADVAFFDELVKSLKADYCVDESRLFSVGYSSGSWFTNLIGCIRPGVLRAGATVSGGFPDPAKIDQCQGRMAQIFVHDKDDPENKIAGSEQARDRLIKANGCKTDPPPVAHGPSPCVRYQGCDNMPVDWCATSGRKHDRQDNFAPAAFWKFFQEL